MPSFSVEDEKRIYDFIIPLIMEGTTEENFREKATQKDPNWCGRDFFLFELLIQEDILGFVRENQGKIEKIRKEIIQKGKKKQYN
jgi:hypothetical protein